MVKPRVQVAASMPEGNDQWMSALVRPSITLSSGALFLGSWMMLLTIINITVGAYSEDAKVLWIGFFTNGDPYSTSQDFVVDDAIFTIMSIVVIGSGIYGINSSKEDGLIGWAKDLPNDRIVTSLYSSKGGMVRIIASWMVLVGFLFYAIWSLMNATWVDPGVYSVMIALVSLGIGLHWVEDSKVSH